MDTCATCGITAGAASPHRTISLDLEVERGSEGSSATLHFRALLSKVPESYYWVLERSERLRTLFLPDFGMMTLKRHSSIR